MIRHIVLLTLKDGTTPDDLASIKASLESMPGAIPQIARYSFGQDLSVSANTADLGIIADFEGVEEFEVYSQHPHHVAAVRDVIKPHVAKKTAMQFAI